MDLMSPAVRWIALACLVVGIVGGTLATSWALPRRWLTLAKNLVVVSLSSVLVFTGIAVELNRRNAWYPTLAQALGQNDDIGGPVVDVGAKGIERTFGRAVTLTRTDDRAVPALPSPGQRRQQFTVPSHGRPWKVSVLLPEGYFDAANAHRAYPVVFFLHGVPGSTAVWDGRMSISALLDPLVHSHQVAPFIAVMPEVTPGGMDSECIVGPDGDLQMETWLSVDVPDMLRARLRVIPQREAWATAGYSAGGWCSAMLTLLHPDVFGAGIVLSGYFEPWFGATRPHWAHGSVEARGHDLVAMVGARRPAVALYVLDARDDSESWPTTRRFLARVKAPTLVASRVQRTGGHSWSLWLPGIVDGMTWLGRQVPGFTP